MANDKTQLNKSAILNKYHNLSPELQDAIFSMDTANAIYKIGSNNRLTVFQIGVLADETGLLLLGVTHPTKFISNLTERMKIDREKAKKVSDETNQLIFSKVRESLKKLNENKPETNKEYYKVDNNNAKKDESSGKNRLSKLIKPVSVGSGKKDIFSERNKDDVMRIKPSVSDVSEKEVDDKKTGPEKTHPGSDYTKGGDPYREPY